MVAHLAGGTGIVVDMYNGSSWDQTVVVSSIDSRDYSWYGTGNYLDLEVDGNDNPVIVLAHNDYSASGGVEIDYYTYDGNSWGSATQIGDFNSGLTFCTGIDLDFDEYDRPFVVVAAKW